MAEPPRFLCDDMFHGLARWLRAAGYDAAFPPQITDHELVARAQREGRIILTSARQIGEWRVIREGKAKVLFLPLRLGNEDALAFVMRELQLDLRDSRCMTCGGELLSATREEARSNVPPGAFRRYDRFWRCASCGKLFWRGAHWDRIANFLTRAREKSVQKPL